MQIINHHAKVRDRLATAFPIPQSRAASLLERDGKAGTTLNLK